jgi:hypothetical protein
MSVDLSNEQQELLQAAIEFDRASLRRDAEMIRADRGAECGAEGWKKCAEFKRFRMLVPAEFGGLRQGLPEVLVAGQGRASERKRQG